MCVVSFLVTLFGLRFEPQNLAITAWVVDLSQGWFPGGHGMSPASPCPFIQAFATVGHMDDKLFQAGDRRIFRFFFGGGSVSPKEHLKTYLILCIFHMKISRFIPFLQWTKKFGRTQWNHTKSPNWHPFGRVFAGDWCRGTEKGKTLWSAMLGQLRGSSWVLWAGGLEENWGTVYCTLWKFRMESFSEFQE